ncbi:MAG: LysR family transcriptional regulator [Rhodobacterales bacterium]|nr:LysR family transcriptional regulator [Rhodobacterales bacterium]
MTSSETPEDTGGTQFSLRRLRAFRALLETGKVTSAARVLGVSQPAVSRMLAQLEDEVGVRLFARRKGRLIPTPEAQVLARDVDKTLTDFERLRRTARGIRDRDEARLRLAVTPLLYQCIVLPSMEAFVADNPDLSVTLEVTTTDTIVERVATGQTELGLASLPVTHPGAEAVTLFRADSVCILPRDHRLAALDVVRPQDLVDEPFIATTRRYPSRHRIDDLFRRAGVPLRVRAETSTAGVACDLVAHGFGVTLLNAMTATAFLGPKLTTRPFAPRLSHEFGFLFRTDQAPSAITRRFVDHLKGAMADRVPPHIAALVEILP